MAEESSSPGAESSVPKEARAVTVELHADDAHATIERRTEAKGLSAFPIKDASLASIATWESACVAPCALRLDARYSYRIAGEGLVPSDVFTLPQDRDHLRLDAKMGSALGRVGGWILTGAGAAGVLLGGSRGMGWSGRRERSWTLLMDDVAGLS